MRCRSYLRTVLGAGAFALAEDVASRLWQTKDHGEHWVEVARPPFEPDGPFVPAGAYSLANPRSMSTIARCFGCR